MKAGLEGKVALVTGAGRGIGRSIGMLLAEHGARVVLASRTFRQIQEVAVEIERQIMKHNRALPVAADISQNDDVNRLFQRISEKYNRLDILVNNAGIGKFGPLEHFPVDEFDSVMSVNVRGTFLCCRYALKLMIPRKSGYIINISSVVGIKGYPNQSAYTASKHAIMGLTKSMAVEAQPHGIRVSAVLPGGVDTELVAQARPDLKRSDLLKPEDIAQTVLYLLSLPDRAAVDAIYIRRRSSSPF